MVDYYALRLLQTAVELPIRCELEYEDPPHSSAPKRAGVTGVKSRS